jgi:FkbM family methyltransferase
MIKRILNKIENERNSKKIFWRLSVHIKDYLWSLLSIIRDYKKKKKIIFKGQELKYLKSAKAVLHVGAHLAQETQSYSNLNKKVIWIEANPKTYRDLLKVIKKFKKQKAINALITNKNNKVYEFKIASNGASSSIFEFGEYHKGKKSLWKQEIKTLKRIRLKSKTLKAILEEKNLKKFNPDFLVLDIQGAELLALQGLDDLIHNFKYILVEVSRVEIYKRGATWKDIKKFLNERDFFEQTKNIPLSGDVLFIRSNEKKHKNEDSNIS